MLVPKRSLKIHLHLLTEKGENLFYPGLEGDIIDMLIDNNISFNTEGEGDLTNEDDEVIASARMILKELKIAIDLTLIHMQKSLQ